MRTMSAQASGHDSSRFARRTTYALFLIEAFVGLMAAVCGVLLLVNGLGMDVSALNQSPFSSFVIPGLVLSLAVGGSLLTAAGLLWCKHAHAAGASFLAGLVLLGWIVAETIWIDGGRALQATVFVLAVTVMELARLEFKNRAK